MIEVFSSQELPREAIGWQLSRFDAVLNKRDIEQVLALETSPAEFAIHANRTAGTA